MGSSGAVPNNSSAPARTTADVWSEPITKPEPAKEQAGPSYDPEPAKQTAEASKKNATARRSDSNIASQVVRSQLEQQLPVMQNPVQVQTAQQTTTPDPPPPLPGESLTDYAKRMSDAHQEKRLKQEKEKLEKEAADLYGKVITNPDAVLKNPAESIKLLELLSDPKSNLTSQEREKLVKSLAGAMKDNVSDTELHKALTLAMKDGKGFEIAGALSRELQALGKTKAADHVAGVTASAVHELRKDFEAKSKKADSVRAELARLLYGFGSTLTQEQQQAAIESFKKKYAHVFEAEDQAAAKLKSVFTQVSDFPKADVNVLKERQEIDRATARFPGSPAQLPPSMLPADGTGMGTAKLHRELGAIDWKKFGQTETGQAALEQAIKGQIEGKKTWLDQLTERAAIGKDVKDGIDSTADVIARTISRMAARGEFQKQEDLFQVLKSNAKGLGIESKKIDELAKAFKESPEKITKAFEDIDGGKYGQSKSTQYALKIIGIGFGAFGVGSNISKWGEKNSIEKLQTIMEGSKLGTDGLTLIAEHYFKGKGVLALERLGGLAGVIGGLAESTGGFGKLVDGNWRDGIGETASGVGGILMGVGTIAGRIPGFQIAGAGLTVAAIIWKRAAGTNPLREAERIAEKDAKDFLISAGMSEKMANALSNLKESDHRNIGTFIQQVAPRLGMTPEQLIARLDSAEVSPEKLRAFVDMALNMPVDKSWKYTEQRNPINANDGVVRGRPTGKYVGPQSMETAIKWMKLNGIVP